MPLYFYVFMIAFIADRRRSMISTMKYDSIIKNGYIVTENLIFTGSIGIKDGKIVTLMQQEDEDAEAAEIVDATGKYVMAGAVDAHVHLNDPGRSHWEDWRCGTRAAAFGGTTCVADMPINSIPALTNAAAFDEKLKQAEEKANIDYLFWGGLENDNLTEIAGMHEKGITGYKAFMSNSGVEFTTANDAILLEGLKSTTDTDMFVGVHEENDAVTAYYGKKMQEQGRCDVLSWVEARPAVQELEAVSRFLFWTEQTKGNGHLCHVSIPEAFDEIARAKSRGVSITAELCAHYLWFTLEDFLKQGPLLKCAPPIREASCKEALWQKVMEEKVDMITSDHSPCSIEEKEKGKDNIWKAWGGVAGIQNVVHVLLTEGVNKRGLSLESVTRMVSANPARRFGVYGKKGVIMPGADADIMIVDLDRKWIFKEEDIYTKSKISPYLGAEFTGKVIRTIVRGRTVFNEKIIPSDGYGEYVRS